MYIWSLSLSLSLSLCVHVYVCVRTCPQNVIDVRNPVLHMAAKPKTTLSELVLDLMYQRQTISNTTNITRYPISIES